MNKKAETKKTNKQTKTRNQLEGNYSSVRAWERAVSCGGVLNRENCLELGQVIWTARGQFYQAAETLNM